MANKLTKAEKETILLTSEADDTGQIYTFSAPLKNRLRKYAARHPELCRLKTEDVETGSVTYIIRKDRLSLRLLEPCNEDRRRAASENAKRAGFTS